MLSSGRQRDVSRHFWTRFLTQRETQGAGTATGVTVRRASRALDWVHTGRRERRWACVTRVGSTGARHTVLKDSPCSSKTAGRQPLVPEKPQSLRFPTRRRGNPCVTRRSCDVALIGAPGLLQYLCQAVTQVTFRVRAASAGRD